MHFLFSNVILFHSKNHKTKKTLQADSKLVKQQQNQKRNSHKQAQ